MGEMGAALGAGLSWVFVPLRRFGPAVRRNRHNGAPLASSMVYGLRVRRLIHAGVVPAEKFFGRVQRTPLLKHEGSEITRQELRAMAISRGCWPFRGLFHGRPFRAPRDPRRTYRKARPAMRSRQRFQFLPRAFGRLKTTISGGGPFEKPAQFVAVADAVACEQGYAFAPASDGTSETLPFQADKAPHGREPG